MKKILFTVLAVLTACAAYGYVGRNLTLPQLVDDASLILVVEKRAPFITQNNYNCCVGFFNYRAYHETIHHFRIVEVLFGDRSEAGELRKGGRIDVHKAYTDSWWRWQKDPPKISLDPIEDYHRSGKKIESMDRVIIFIRKAGDRFQYVVHDAYEPLDNKDEIIRLIRSVKAGYGSGYIFRE